MNSGGKLNGLDVFSGIGGITLALESYVRPIAYCENDTYAQAVLLSRMREGRLPLSPIWEDVRTLHGSNLPESIDIITGGFPCQDISAAGLGAGLEGKRSGLYWEFHRLVKEIRPTFVFLENVPAIRTRGLKEVVRSLSRIGYDCRWTIVSAQEVGAPHLRKRWFLLAHANGQCLRFKQQRLPGRRATGIPDQEKAKFGNHGASGALAFASGSKAMRRQKIQRHESHGNIERAQSMADADSERYSGRGGRGGRGGRAKNSARSGLHVSGRGEIVANANGSGFEFSQEMQAGQECGPGRNSASGGGWWKFEPNVGRVANGISAWLDGVDYANCMAEMVKYGLQSMENPAKALRALWKNDGKTKIFERGIRISDDVCPPEVLLPFLRRCEIFYTQKYLSQKSPEVSRNRMRVMPNKQASSGPSHRSKSRKQSAGKHSNALLNMSQFLAQDCATKWARDRRAYATNRVDRLRGLGNSVVPLQAKTAFERLMGLAE